jgi:hypothetical protein
MSEGFGMESPGGHTMWPHRKPVRYLVLIDAGELTIARLFLESREQVAEFDGGAEEVALMTRGLASTQDAYGADWDHALQAHTAAERGAAKVYTLDV